jgi:hypothetical protein
LKTIIDKTQVYSSRSYDELVVMLKKLMNPCLSMVEVQDPITTISECWGCQETLIATTLEKRLDATETSVPDSDIVST